MSLIARRFIHEVAVEPFTGEGARGSAYGAAVTVACRVQEAADYQHGEAAADQHEVVASTVVYLPYGTTCPPRSRITLPGGRTGTAVEVHTHTGLPHLRHLKVVVR